MFDKFTERSVVVVQRAQEEARKTFQHESIGTEHLLLGLIREEEGLAAQVLDALGLNRKNVTDSILEMRPKENVREGQIPFTKRAKQALEQSLRESLNLGQPYIGTEHLLLGLTAEQDGSAVEILHNYGVSTEQVRSEVLRLLEVPGQDDLAKTGGGEKDKKNSTLADHAENLTQMARDKELEPIIGRETELERMIQILARKTKNNPMLLGDPGVGKTAIVEGFAQAIVDGEVPHDMVAKEVWSLDLASLVAGTRYRGEFEERFKNILKEIKEAGNIILFIDEIHTLVGAGAAEGAIDAASMLKPPLARGQLRTIGATTTKEFRKHFETDQALERRFQQVEIKEPSVAETVMILTGVAKSYEEHHGVIIRQEAAEAAADLAERYITDRFLPDKAIDLIDEASARIRIQSLKENPLIKELDEEITASRKKLEAAIADQDFETAHAVRDSQKELSRQRRELLDKADPKKTLSDEDIEMMTAEERKEIEEMKKASVEFERRPKPKVEAEQIAEVVSMWTGIPVFKLTEAEGQKLTNMEDALHKRVIGQKAAVAAVSKAIRRSRAGIKDPKRPVGSFIFLGPTGVGKTELAKTLTEFLFNDDTKMTRIDMSEYRERHSTARLIGSPPGYIGHEEGGQLTEAVRTHPYSVILLDEIEKAHKAVYDILLQIIEDGHLTDGKGRTVDFKNTIIIMTSNIGSQEISQTKKLGFDTGTIKETNFTDSSDNAAHNEMKKKIMHDLKQTFRPEMINRMDEIVVFHKLAEEEILKIVDLMLNSLRKRLVDKHIQLTLTDKAKVWLSKKGYDANMGARPLRRAIQQEIEDPLADMILDDPSESKRIAVVDVAKDGQSLKMEFVNDFDEDLKKMSESESSEIQV